MRYLIVTASLLFCSLVMAQPDHHGHDHGDGQMMEKRLEHMTEQLDLTPEQRQRMEQIMRQHQSSMKKEYERMDKKMRKVLTEEQIERLESLRQQRHERRKEMKHRRSEHNGPH